MDGCKHGHYLCTQCDDEAVLSNLKDENKQLQKEYQELKDRQKRLMTELAEDVQREEELAADNKGLRAECRRLLGRIEQLEISLPFFSGRDENKAAEALGEVMRHPTSETASIGVVEVNRAKRVLVHSYADNNALNNARERWRGVFKDMQEELRNGEKLTAEDLALRFNEIDPTP